MDLKVNWLISENCENVFKMKDCTFSIFPFLSVVFNSHRSKYYKCTWHGVAFEHRGTHLEFRQALNERFATNFI